MHPFLFVPLISPSTDVVTPYIFTVQSLLHTTSRDKKDEFDTERGSMVSKYEGGGMGGTYVEIRLQRDG